MVMAVRQVDLKVTGMTCASCVNTVERSLNKLAGVQAFVNLAMESAHVIAPTQISEQELMKQVEAAGYKAAPFKIETESFQKSARLGIRVFFTAILAIPTIAISMVNQIQTPIDKWLSNFIIDIQQLWARTFNAEYQARLAIDPTAALQVLEPTAHPHIWLQLILAFPIVFFLAWPIHRASLKNLRHPTMDTLVSLGSLTAFGWSVYAISEPKYQMSGFSEVAAAVLFFVMLGRLLEHRARKSAASALIELFKLSSGQVELTNRGIPQLIDIVQLQIGDQYRIKPGEKIATDGVVISGFSSVNNAFITGESIPIEVGTGAKVFAGAINNNGVLIVEATEVGSETQLSQITKLILQAQNQKAPAQILADRISAVFVPVVIALAIFTFLTWQYLPQVWPQLAEQISNQFGGVNFAELTKSLQNAIAVIVVACPCALGLATPIALMVAGGRGAQLGIVLRSPRALHRSSEITDVIFDKTGTLTAGSFKLINMELVETPLTSKDGSTTISTNQLMSFAMTIEQQDSHPIAKAIAAGIEKLGIKPSQISEFEHRPGQGVAARLEGKYAVLIGSPISIARASTTFNPRIDLAINRATENGNSVAVLAIDGLAYGVFEIGDEVRAEAASALNLMSARKIKTWLATGDNKSAAMNIAKSLPLNSESILAEISPQGKWEFVKKLQSQNKKVLMIGDGINDAASLAQADLSMAIGTGTATANAASDISLVNPSLLTAITALDLMAKTNKVIRSNLGWAFVYNLICIPLAATGTLPAMYAGIAMSLSSIFVSLNSLRVRAVQPIQRELSKKYKW